MKLFTLANGRIINLYHVIEIIITPTNFELSMTNGSIIEILYADFIAINQIVI